MSFVAFDIEIRNELPEGDDWKKARPLGITCAATITSDGEEKVWHGGMCTEWATWEMLPPQMSPEECHELASYLEDMQSSGYPIVTWNGLGFDFDILAEEVQDQDVAAMLKEVALDHIDVAFAMFCERGFMCGLDAAAKGLGLPGKTAGMKGSLAPAMWAAGPEEQGFVLGYVLQDVRTTAQVYTSILEQNELIWITKAGTPAKRPWLPTFHSDGCPSRGDKRLLTVREALSMPLPDVSWMKDPWPRSKFCGWLETGKTGEREA